MNNGIGQAVKYYREKAQITQREFAKMLGFKNHSSIARIECGAQDVLISTVEEMARIFHISPVAFFFFSEEDLSEYMLPLAEASEGDLCSIQKILGMPEKKEESCSVSMKEIS